MKRYEKMTTKELMKSFTDVWTNPNLGTKDIHFWYNNMMNEVEPRVASINTKVDVDKVLADFNATCNYCVGCPDFTPDGTVLDCFARYLKEEEE